MSVWGPLDASLTRKVRRSHSIPLISRTRTLEVDSAGKRVDGTTPNTVMDYNGNMLYVEHYLWQEKDLTPYMHPDDYGKQIIYSKHAIKLIISDNNASINRMTTIAVKIIPPGTPAEAGPTDFQQPQYSPSGIPINWIENIAQMVCRSPDSPRSWQECTVAPVNNKILWGAMFRPVYPSDVLGMAFSFFFEEYTLDPNSFQ